MNGASFVGWIYDPTARAVIHQIRPFLVELGAVLLFIAILGWWTAVGLRREDVRIPYVWSLVPVAGFAALTLAACASPKVAGKGLGFVALAMLIVFVAALTEELIFRGVVLHSSRAPGAGWPASW